MQLMFDLDGTLTDSRVGVTRCIQHALVEAGLVVPPVEELTRYVRPPLPASFNAAATTSAEGEVAARHFATAWEDPRANQ